MDDEKKPAQYTLCRQRLCCCPIYPQENKGHDIEDLMKKSYAVIESALPLKG